MGRQGRRFVLSAALCALLLGVLVPISFGGFGAAVQQWGVDLGELLCAAIASAAAAYRVGRSAGRQRRGWTWLSVACGSWAVGQGFWSWFELLLGHEAPFPSVADLGYIGFSLAGVVALWLLPVASPHARQRTRLLDGLTVATAIGLISWFTTLRAVIDAGGASRFALSVSMSYPIADVVVLTMCVLALASGVRQRGSLVLVTVGVMAMAFADSRFAYTTALGTYETGAVDLGWCAAFLLMALACVLPDSAEAPGVSARVHARTAAALPYATLLAAGIVVLQRYLVGDTFDGPFAIMAMLLVSLVLARQWLVLRENQTLVEVVEQRETQLRHQAFHDSLTGLANRSLFTDRVAHGLELARRDLRSLTVAFLDLDGFKSVNDRLGHVAGDDLLVRVGERLRGTLRAGDTLARIGGDEFAVLLEDCDDAGAMAVADKMLSVLRTPFVLSGKEVTISASIGLARHEAGEEVPTVATLLAHADLAMYDVKRHGKDDARLHTSGLHLEELDDLALQPALARAIAERQVRPAFQPIVSLDAGQVSGIEVLARWRHQDREVPPSMFVAVAERTGLAPALTDLMVDAACAQLARWRALPGGCDLVLGVNISPGELVDERLPARVAEALRRHDVPGSQLLLEVTESALVGDTARVHTVMHEITALGVTFALDDFGTGYSSLALLTSLPLACVKIDRVFVTEIDVDAERRKFLEGVLAFTRHIGLRVVVEGIERQGQLDELRRLGCTWVQGYLTGRPAPGGAVPPTWEPAAAVEPSVPAQPARPT